MKWENDPYKRYKWEIFDMLKHILDEEDVRKISVKQLADAIDEFIEKLIKVEE